MDIGYYNENSMSSAQLRKIRKPIIERKRRERINRCLEQIKTLVLRASDQDESKYEKMDKADILEMAVSHLLEAQKQKMQATYQTGYSKCATQVQSYLSSVTSPQMTGVSSRLMSHLAATQTVRVRGESSSSEEDDVRCSSAPQQTTSRLSPSALPSSLATPPHTPLNQRTLVRTSTAAVRPVASASNVSPPSNDARQGASSPVWRPW